MSEGDLGWRDRWAMFLDCIEYFLRRSACRIAGHRWKEQKEWFGDQPITSGYFCLICHREEAP